MTDERRARALQALIKEDGILGPMNTIDLFARTVSETPSV